MRIPRRKKGAKRAKSTFTKQEKPSYYSISQIQTFACPLRYKYRYYYGLKTESNVYAEFGVSIHKELENLFRGDYSGLSAQSKEYVTTVEKFYQKIGDRPKLQERNFEVKLGRFTLNGVIDVVTEGGRLIDYKVTSSPSYLKGYLGFQLPLYRYAARKMGLGDLNPMYLFLKRDSQFNLVQLEQYMPKITRRQEAFAVKMAYNIMKKMDELWGTGCASVDYKHCRLCDFRSICPGTLDEGGHHV